MSAKRSINPNQLRLFMTARELREHFDPSWGDFEGDETAEQLWDRKLQASKDNGLYDDIKDIGVRVPVTITENPDGSEFKPEVKGGHHRIAAAYDINPDMEIPVNYDGSTQNAWDVEIERGISDPVLQQHVKKKYGGFGNLKSEQGAKGFKRLNGW
jgi:hypothetical protein